jgi:hypothetical protein
MSSYAGQTMTTSENGDPPLPPTLDRIRDSLSRELKRHVLDEVPRATLEALAQALDDDLFGNPDDAGTLRALADRTLELHRAQGLIFDVLREVPTALYLDPNGLVAGRGVPEAEAPILYRVLDELRRRAQDVRELDEAVKALADPTATPDTGDHTRAS